MVEKILILLMALVIQSVYSQNIQFNNPDDLVDGETKQQEKTTYLTVEVLKAIL